MTQNSLSMVIRYSDGQYTFRNFREDAVDIQLYTLARTLNSFQECDIEKVLKVRVMQF